MRTRAVTGATGSARRQFIAVSNCAIRAPRRGPGSRGIVNAGTASPRPRRSRDGRTSTRIRGRIARTILSGRHDSGSRSLSSGRSRGRMRTARTRGRHLTPASRHASALATRSNGPWATRRRIRNASRSAASPSPTTRARSRWPCARVSAASRTIAQGLRAEDGISPAGAVDPRAASDAWSTGLRPPAQVARYVPNQLSIRR